VPGSVTAAPRATGPTPAQVAQVRAFNRFYTNVIGVLHGMYLGTPYTLTEGRLLFEIAGHGTVEVSWLRQALDIDAGYLSRVLSRFEAEGLVTRRRSPADARRQQIRATDAGRAAAAELDARAAGQVGGLLGGVDCGRLLGAMRTITEILGQPPRDATRSDGTAPDSAVPANAGPGNAGPDSAGPGSAGPDGAGLENTGPEKTGHGRKDQRTVTLRPLAPGDLGWVLQRHGTVYAAEFGWDASFEAVCARIIGEYATLRERHPERTEGWIAEVDGAPAGCVFCVPDSETTARLRLLLVEPWARGLGLGSSLVGQCLDFARRVGYADIVLWTYDMLAAARRVYQSAGFTLESEYSEEAFGHSMMSQTWSRALSPPRSGVAV
jgi:DNA-binding MarR family transcriptional regulator/GNAT superfamily N-acetyltransferase